VHFDAERPPFSACDPIVVKIGGSLAGQAEKLFPIVETLNTSARPIAIVIGGGAFADAVRDAQSRLGLSDSVAHRMAILAMHQNALAIASLAPNLRLFESIKDMNSAIARNEKAIWLPLIECDADSDLPASWEATSDAIATRLGERLGGMPVVFIKSRAATGSCLDPSSLAAEKLIDPVAAEILDRTSMPFTIIEAHQTKQLANLLVAPGAVDGGGRA